MMKLLWPGFAILVAVAGCSRTVPPTAPPAGNASRIEPVIGYNTMIDTNPIAKIVRTDEEWKKLLTPEQYTILRAKGTEPAFCGAFHDSKEPGTYHCAACDLDLFVSDAKFDSGTGWPSFFTPVASNRVLEKADNSHGMRRVETLCARCDSHLGHVFDDGPAPTHKRYCMNSAALKFVTRKDAKK